MWRRALPAVVAGLAAVVTLAAQQPVGRPGTVNWIEGEVQLEGQALNPASVAGAEMAPGQVLATQKGKAEVLLTPGVFLRLDANSSVKLLQRAAGDTRVKVVSGRAVVEAARVDGALQIIAGPVRARVDKPGVYEFSAGSPAVEAFAGKARVEANDRAVELGRGKELTLSGNAFSEKKLKSHASNEFYAWNAGRARVDADASTQTSIAMAATSTEGWHGGDWYWNPFLGTWVFLPSQCAVTGPLGEQFFSPVFYHDFGGTGGQPIGYLHVVAD